jgi:hypothetical protein
MASTREQRKATNLELQGLYNIQQSSYLNLLYYGARAARWAFWNLWLQVGASVGSLGAVTGFLTVGGTELGKWISAFVGAASAVCAALPAIMGHAEKVNKFEKLHFAYSELYQLVMRTALDVRRAGIITEEQVGAVKLLGDLYSRLGQMDDPDRNDKLAEKYEQVVRDKFPRSGLWYAVEDGRSGEKEPTSASGEKESTSAHTAHERS